MIKRVCLIIVLGLMFHHHASSQCNDRNIAFRPGEEVIYHAYYNWGFIWVNAGIVSFNVEDHTYDGNPAYFIKAYGRTYSSYDFLYKVRDTFEVYVDTMHLQPYEFNRINYEGHSESHHHYKFDRETGTINTHISKDHKPYKDSVLVWKDCTFDLLSMVYKARNIDFDRYQKGDKIPIRMIVDGKIYDLYIHYKGKSIVKNRDGRKFRCYEFSPLLVAGTIFSSGDGMTVWVTDDKNRIPIIVKAKILIGSVKAMFVSAKGLRHPMEAEIIKD